MSLVLVLTFFSKITIPLGSFNYRLDFAGHVDECYRYTTRHFATDCGLYFHHHHECFMLLLKLYKTQEGMFQWKSPVFYFLFYIKPYFLRYPTSRCIIFWCPILPQPQKLLGAPDFLLQKTYLASWAHWIESAEVMFDNSCA